MQTIMKRSDIYRRNARYADSLGELNRAAMMRIPSAELLNRRAMTNSLLGEREEALRDYEAVVKKRPKDLHARLCAIELRLALYGDFERAAEEYTSILENAKRPMKDLSESTAKLSRRLIEKNPENKRAREMLVIALAKGGRCKEAFEELDKFAAMGKKGGFRKKVDAMCGKTEAGPTK